MQCFSRSMMRLCSGAAASGAATPVAQKKTFSFQKRFDAIQSEPNSVLGGAEYGFLRERLSEYSGLQQQYAVKQSDVERARRAAHMCGLEFTGKGSKKPTKTDS